MVGALSPKQSRKIFVKNDLFSVIFEYLVHHVRLKKNQTEINLHYFLQNVFVTFQTIAW